MAPPGVQTWPMRILLVEDDDAIADPVMSRLRREGFEVDRERSGHGALDAAETDLVLLDLGLPDLDGQEVCRRLRERSQVPIIVVSARAEELDRVLLLELGADDYLVKPFGSRELLARIRAVLRRAGGDRTDPSAVQTVEIGELSVDRRARRVAVAGEEITLTPKEFDVLSYLAEDPGAVFSRDRILRDVWETEWWGPTKTLDVHVASLRRKLGDPGWIETVRGVGFRLRPAP